MSVSKFLLLPVLAFCGALPLIAQTGHVASITPVNNADVISALPDAPQPVGDTGPPLNAADKSTAPVAATKPAGRYQVCIDPNETTKVLSNKEKFAYSFREQVSAYAGASMLISAGWEQLLDSDPKYGTDAAAFGKRLGIAAVRQTSQAVFTDGVFAPVFHQDPRYYRKVYGSFWERSGYVVKRVLVKRQDSGKEAPNYSLLLGYASASALTMAYYPAESAKWSNTAEGYGLSVLANVGGNAVHEFWPDFVQFFHHDHN
jgi:hypothetical protein